MANRFDALFQAAAAKYGLDPDLLRAVQLQENPKGDFKAVGPVPAVGDPNDRAIGLMQIRQSIANKLGIDPRNPAQAIDGAALLLAQSMRRNNNDPELAVTEYHGGTDPANWGPKTQNYVNKVAGYFQQLKSQPQPQMAQSAQAPTMQPQASNDPILAALSGSGAPAAAKPQAVASDPIMLALQGKLNVPAAPQTKPTAPQPAQPRASNSLMDYAGDFANAAIHHTGNLFHGGAQLVENAIDKGFQQLPDNPVSRYVHGVAQQDNAAMQQREQQYQANTPTNPASIAGATVGEVLPFMAGGGIIGQTGKTAAAAPIIRNSVAASKIANAAGQGLMAGTLAPVTDPRDYWAQKGGQAALGAVVGGGLGAAGQVVGKGAAAVNNSISPLINPTKAAANTLRKVVGDATPQDLAAALSNNGGEIVAGSRPTLAQVLQTPEAVQLEKAMANRPEYRTLFEQRMNDNNLARLNAINSVAGTPEDLAAAIQNRSNVAGPLYEAAKAEQIVPDQTLTGILGTPAGSAALQRARTLAQNAQDATPIVTEAGDLTGTGAHYLKMAFDAMLDEGKRTGMAGAEQNAIRNLRGNYVDWLEAQSPAYAGAKQAYREASVPISDMEAGQSITNSLGNRALNSAGDPLVTLPGYNAALAKALRNSEYGISDSANSTLNSVQQDLQRASVSNSLRSAGSDTWNNMATDDWLARQLVSGKPDSSALPKAIAAAAGSVIPGVGTMGGWLGAGQWQQAATKKAADALAEALLNPQSASNLINMPQTTISPYLIQALRGAPVAPAAADAATQLIQ
jgi:hypothetical protein